MSTINIEESESQDAWIKGKFEWAFVGSSYVQFLSNKEVESTRA